MPATFEWTEREYLEFTKHVDIFNDGKIILVPLPGHSFGSIGLIINGAKEKYFFVGDSIWMERQLNSPVHKAFFASLLVDRDKDILSDTINKIKLMRDKHKFKIIPTHDASIHDKFGYYPKRIDVLD